MEHHNQNSLVVVWFYFFIKELPDRLPEDVVVRVEDLPDADVCHSIGLC